MDETRALTIEALQIAYRDGVLTPSEVVELCLERIDRLDGELNAFVRVWPDEAREVAAAAGEQRRGDGEKPPLLGIPVAIKDLIDVAGQVTTSGSRVHLDRRAEKDAFVVRRLREAGAILLGKTNLHEFAFGVTNQVSGFGPTQNPWDPSRMSGGSSGGSAAAVAAGLVPGALGTDTGGSIRIPASLCGVVGLKPTYGRVSCRGVWPLSWTLDHVGPLARSVSGAAFLLEAIATPDPEDPARAVLPPFDARQVLDQHPTGWRVGYDPAWCFGETQPDVGRAFEGALAALGELGVEVVEIAIPELERVQEQSIVLLRGDADAVHRELLAEHRDLYHPETRLRLEEGSELRAGDQARALRFQRSYALQAVRLFDRVDAILSPTTPCTAPPGEATSLDWGAGPKAIRPLLTRFMRLYNFLGWPALSLPMGRDEEGLPIGLQIAAAPGQEPVAVALGRALEEQRGGPEPLAEP